MAAPLLAVSASAAPDMVAGNACHVAVFSNVNETHDWWALHSSIGGDDPIKKGDKRTQDIPLSALIAFFYGVVSSGQAVKPRPSQCAAERPTPMPR